MRALEKILCVSMAAVMIAGLTACDDESAPAESANNPVTATTPATTTTKDPDENAPTDAEIKQVDTDAYTRTVTAARSHGWAITTLRPTAALSSSTRYSPATSTAARSNMCPARAGLTTLRR